MAEDNPQDVELAIEALTEHNPCKPCCCSGDGVEVLEYLNYEGQFKNRKKGNPAVFTARYKKCHGWTELKSWRPSAAMKNLKPFL